MNNQSPFLDIPSFEAEKEDISETFERLVPSSPFLPIYETEDEEGLVTPETQEYYAFLNELYDEEFDKALAGLVNEASALIENRFMDEVDDPETAGYRAERLLTEHFAPLVMEIETMLDHLVEEFRQRDPYALTEDEIESIISQYSPSAQLNPVFEEWLGWVKKKIGKGISFAKKGVAAVATGGLSLILPKLKFLARPLLMKVINLAIGKLPPHLRPIARKLAGQHRLLRELEEEFGASEDSGQHSVIAEIQLEFDRQIADLIFAGSEVEQDLEIAEAIQEQDDLNSYPIAELETARETFVENLENLQEGEDPTPYVENFLPAILPALRIGIKIAGKNRIKKILANLVAKLIRRFVGRNNAHPLSRAIVDVGFRLLNLEVTEEEASRAASSQVASVVEETVRRVAEAPEYVLEDQELLEGFIVEAFEQAAASYLPPVLSEEIYQNRPDLAKYRKMGGIWMRMPFRPRRMRRRRKLPFKIFSRKFPFRLSPHKVSTLETFEGIPLGEILEEQFGIAPGEEIEGLVHLYEAGPGTNLMDIVRQDENLAKLGKIDGYLPLQPLTREAARLLVGDPEVGHSFDLQPSPDPTATLPGQRYYHLELPGHRPLLVSQRSGRARARRPSQVRLFLNFQTNEVRVYLFLSEVRSQEIVVKSRRGAHVGTMVTRVQGLIERGLRSALMRGAFGRLKIIHETVTPRNWSSALKRVPMPLARRFLGLLTEWVIKGFSDLLKQRSEEFRKSAEDTADGVSVIFTFGNPPGFPQLRDSLRGKPSGTLKSLEGTPAVTIRVVPGYFHE